MNGNYTIYSCKTLKETGKYKKLKELDSEMKRKPLPEDYKEAAKILGGFVCGVFDIKNIPEFNSVSELERWKKEKIRQILK